MLTTFPQWNFSLEFPEIPNQNLICYHWPSVSGNSEIMHCGILYLAEIEQAPPISYSTTQLANLIDMWLLFVTVSTGAVLKLSYFWNLPFYNRGNCGNSLNSRIIAKPISKKSSQLRQGMHDIDSHQNAGTETSILVLILQLLLFKSWYWKWELLIYTVSRYSYQLYETSTGDTGSIGCIRDEA